MAKKRNPYPKLRTVVEESEREIAKLPRKSASSQKRTRHYVRILMVAIKYPSALPEDMLEDLANQLLSFHDDDDTTFVMTHFGELERAGRTAENEHAVQHAEEVDLPKELRKKD